MTAHDAIDVVVVGAGHNGLVAACYLAQAGLRVEVLEASPTIGGMTSTNPTLAGAPNHLINEGSVQGSLWRATSIKRDLGLERYGLREFILPATHAQVDPEGASLAIWCDPRKTADEIRRFSPRDADAWLTLARDLDAAMDFVLPYMLSHPTRLSRDVIVAAIRKGPGALRRLDPLVRLMTASHAELIAERFEHPLTRGALAAMPPFSWMTQDGTGWALIYVGLLHRIGGVAMFGGGTGGLPSALRNHLLDHRGNVRVSSPVEALTTKSGRVTGVRLADGEEITARAVLTACSPKTTLGTLLPQGMLPEHLQRRVEHLPSRLTEGGSLKINIALRGRLTMPRHNPKRRDGFDLRVPVTAWNTLEEHVAAWEAVVARRWPDPIPVIFTVPTATDPSQAPDGQDVAWIWSGIAPVRAHEPWNDIRDKIGQRVVDAASQYYDGIEELEISRSVLAAPDIEARFNVPDGNIYHLDALFQRFGPLRPALGLGGYGTPVPGLFLTGAGTHPSGGISGIPGQLAARTVLRSLRAGDGIRSTLLGRRPSAV
jgi:phytoene dehydrogenase-like protein